MVCMAPPPAMFPHSGPGTVMKNRTTCCADRLGTTRRFRSRRVVMCRQYNLIVVSDDVCMIPDSSPAAGLLQSARRSYSGVDLERGKGRQLPCPPVEPCPPSCPPNLCVFTTVNVFTPRTKLSKHWNKQQMYKKYKIPLKYFATALHQPRRVCWHAEWFKHTV